MENQIGNSGIRKSSYGILGGILFLIFTLYRLFGCLNVLILIGYGTCETSDLVDPIILFIAYAIITVTLIRQKRTVMLLAGFAIPLVLSLYDFIKYGRIASSLKVNDFFGCMVMFLILTITFMNVDEKYKKIIKMIWFVPAVCAVVSIPFYWENVIWSMNSYSGISLRVVSVIILISHIFYAVALLLAARWCVFPEEMLIPDAEMSRGMENGTQPFVSDEAYCGMAKHILLLLLTFGIWWYVWVYRTTAYLNCIEEPRNPKTKWLLCMFVPFYAIYWIYTSAKRIDKLAKEKRISSEISVPCLILAIFFTGIIPSIIMQSKINDIITLRNGSNNEFSQTGVGVDAIDELKKYKGLLDDGIITQEEFETKKRQLLNL